jgi:hypothetical protein
MEEPAILREIPIHIFFGRLSGGHGEMDSPGSENRYNDKEMS